jgi:thiol-disulfide isomerase/thioredoxin
MTRRLQVGLVVLAVAAGLAAQTTKPDPAVQALRALLAEHDSEMQAFHKAVAAAKTAAEQQKVYQEMHSSASRYAPRFMALAGKHPDSPAAVDALIWVALNPIEAAAKESELRPRALALLRRNHLKNDKLGRLCTQMVQTVDTASEEFLQTLLEKSPVAGIQARACASLAQNLKHRGRLIPRLEEDAEAVKEYEQMWGKAAIASLRKQKPSDVLARSEKLFELLAEKHGKVKHPLFGSLAGMAKAHLLSLRQPVQIDRPAPEIEGVIGGGKALRLSEHKGKVVLLDFWAHFLPSCRAGYEIERDLVKRLADKPFVILGVNGDVSVGALVEALKAEKITWRSWHDGGYTGGPIATRWDVEVWPTLFLIDHKGIVRKRFIGWDERKDIEKAIDDLVRAAGK